MLSWKSCIATIVLSQNPRQLAFLTLRSVHKGAFADVALNRTLQQANLFQSDIRLLTELVYGTIRRQRTLDALIDQLGKKNSHQQPEDLRLILHLGLYQLRYLDHIPESAAVNTTVELAKQNGFAKLSGVVNGMLRQYGRLMNQAPSTTDPQPLQEAAIAPTSETVPSLATKPAPFDPLHFPRDPVQRLGVLHSYPDWIVEVWLNQFGFEETEHLCEWMNQPPSIDLRVNSLKVSVEQVESALQAAGVMTRRIAALPHGLRLLNAAGSIRALPGFDQGWWVVQDASAQLVSYLLDPHPGELVIDACAAPGGKTTHIAELMQDQGTVWACDKTASRLQKLRQNCDRLQIRSTQIQTGDSRRFDQFVNQGDRVLLDAPCSGLGTLHRHADARWRQTPTTVKELVQLQAELLSQTASWVKPGGVLVYSTCTLHPAENEQQIEQFLAAHPTWRLVPPESHTPSAAFVTPEGWVKVLPHHHFMDGFFMARMQLFCSKP